MKTGKGLLAPIRRPFESSVLALSHQRQVDGITLYTADRLEEGDDIPEAFAGSLALLRAVDPANYSLVRRFARRVLIVERPRSHYWASTGVSVLSSHFSSTSSPAYLAHALIYHAVQTRFRGAGIWGGAKLRARVDAACMRAQLAFARRLSPEEWPNVQALIDSLEHRLGEMTCTHPGHRSA